VVIMKIPSQAKRVFEGKIFDVYQWEQEMFDGSRQTFEMLKRPDTVQILAIIGDKILTVKEDQPNVKNRLGFLGGRVDAGEKPLAAAKREILEEAGLVFSDWELFKIYEPFRKMDWKIYFYIARNCRKAAEPIWDSGEKIKSKKLSFDEFIKIYSSEKYLGGDFGADLLRIRLDKKKLKNFKKKLFPFS